MRSIVAAVLAVFLLSSVTESRVRTGFDVVRVVRGDDSRGPFSLGVTGLIAGTDSVFFAGRALVRDRDYTLSSKDGSLELSSPLPRGESLTFIAKRQLIAADPVRRRVLPGDDRSQIVTSAAGETTRRVSRRSARSEAEGLTVSGVKRFQVSVGSSPEAPVSQSLKLEVSGMLAEGVRVSGFLTDRSLPVQSSGRTRSIQELDRVRLEVASPTFSAGLGDVEVALEGTTFGRYHRQLQGARFRMRGRSGDVDLFGAVSEGTWETRRVTVRPGYQGPYALSTRRQPIAAGSERLYLNGEALRRGEGQDYVIDYDRGLVTFTPARPIRGESRVTTEFQTVDPEGRLRSLGMRGQLATGDDRLRLGTTVIRESRGGPSGVTTVPGTPGALLSSVDGTYAPVDGLRLDGEVAWSRADAAAGHASRVGLTWTAPQAREAGGGMGAVSVTGSFRRIAPSFRALDRVNGVAREGTWGWEQDAVSDAGTVGEVAIRYAPSSFAAVTATGGKRTGALAGRRGGMVVTLDGYRGRTEAAYEVVDRTGGRITRAQGSASGTLGWLRPTLRVSDELATGLAVRGSRLFYARPGATLPAGVRVREGVLTTEAGSRRLSVTSTLAASAVDRLADAWSDSVREWSHTTALTATVTSGFRFSGSFGQTARRDRSVGPEQSVVNLGRVQMSYRPGSGVVSQQLQYEVSSTGLADSDRQFVEVPDGDGSYVWEDVDGDGERDPEEFVPEAGGNYEPVYGLSGAFDPVRESSVGLRTVVDFGRLRNGGALRELSVEVALESERRGRPEAGVSIAPWSHAAFDDGVDVVAARHAVRTTIHLFRRQRLGSIRVDGRVARDVDRRLDEAGRTRVSGLTFVGKLRPLRGWDLAATAEGERRLREGSGAFAHDVTGYEVDLRNWVRLPDGWQTGIGIAWGRDREARRGLTAGRVSVGPEVRRALRGRGRLTSRFDWTRVTSEDRLPLFLGLADGHRRGQSYRWRVGVDYRLGTYVDAFVTYDGTVRPERPALHVGRMELRASF